MKKKYGVISFIVTAIILTMLIPDDGIFKYNYQIGGRWEYETLTAPFDFPILKTSKEYDADIRKLNKKFAPIYVIDTSVAAKVLNTVVADFGLKDSIEKSVRDSVGEKLYNMLSDIFTKGVITEYANEAILDYPLIRIIKEDSIRTTDLENIFTTKQLQDSINAIAASVPNVGVGNIVPEKYVIDNLRYDRDLSDADRTRQVSRISLSKGFVTKGSAIVSNGQIIDESIYNILNSYRRMYSERGSNIDNILTTLGNFLYVSIILTLSFVFLFYFRKGFSQKSGNVLFLLFIYIFMVGLTRLVSSADFLNIYMIPFAIVPFFIITFYDLRMSIFEYVSVLILCAAITANPFETFFINIFPGLAGVFVSRNIYLRGRLMLAAGVVLITYSVSFIAISLMQQISLADIKWSTMFWFVINAILFLALYQLIYLFERVFGFVTNITLFELCDTNQPLLKELSLKAPGTFQHSIQVANLAEAAAKEIGANPIYARVGALYHDIGKSCNQMYFIENVTGTYSPHKDMDPLQSAEIIKKHVTDGVTLAKKYNIPSVVVDFIETHHGTSLIYYFYRSYIEKYGEEKVDISQFTYSGPLPESKEASICMMADAIEAASRSMKEFKLPEIESLVDKIVSTQIEEGQFADSLLSFSEITIIKKVFVQKLANIYHTRIEYPER